MLYYDVNAVCVGYGFLPSNEIARALGCRHRMEDECLTTIVDADGLTSVEGVYAVGDMIALRGARAAQAQGSIAGCAVARSLGLPLPVQVARTLRESTRRLARHLSFQRALWSLFAAPSSRATHAAPDTIVCRCEHVARAAVEDAATQGATSLGMIKRRTRVGMGRCQGRYCESIIAAMLPQSVRDERFAFAPRVPFKPIRIEDVT
jgi:NAD(P)H-nitrite reductase large subunit